MRKAKIIGSVVINFTLKMRDRGDIYKDSYLIKQVEKMRDIYTENIEKLFKRACPDVFQCGDGTVSINVDAVSSEPVIVDEEDDTEDLFSNLHA